MADKSAIYELRMAGMSEQDAINEAEFIARQQRTIDALVAALEEAIPYVARYESENMSNVALAVYDKGRAALALARGEG